MSINLVMASNHLILCHPLLLPSIFHRIRVFSIKSVLSSGSQSTAASASASEIYYTLLIYSCSWVGRLIIVRIPNYLQIHLQIPRNPNQNARRLFCRNGLILIFTWKLERLEIAKAILKTKSIVGGLKTTQFPGLL